METFTALKNIKQGGKIVPPGKPIELDEDDVKHLGSIQAIDPDEHGKKDGTTEPAMTGEERATAIASAVGKLADDGWTNKGLPRVPALSAAAGFKVTAEEAAVYAKSETGSSTESKSSGTGE